MDCLVDRRERLSSIIHGRVQPLIKRNIKRPPANLAVGWRQAILGKHQCARIVHRGMRIEAGWIRKARAVERQAVCLSLFCHPTKRDVSKLKVRRGEPRASPELQFLLDLRNYLNSWAATVRRTPQFSPTARTSSRFRIPPMRRKRFSGFAPSPNRIFAPSSTICCKSRG